MSENELPVKAHTKRIFLGAFQIAVFFIPAYALNVLLLHALNSNIVSMLVMPVIFGALSFTAVLGNSGRDAIYKCSLSLPMSLFAWLYLINTEFYERSLNWITPDYDIAGERSKELLILGIMALINIIALLVGIFVSKASSRNDKSFAVKEVFCLAAAGAVLLAIVVLNVVIPYRG